MESQGSSPRPMVKVTYLERQKKNAAEPNDNFTEASFSKDKPHNDTKKSDSLSRRGSSSKQGTSIQEGKPVDNFRVPDAPLKRVSDEAQDSIKQKSSPSMSTKDKKSLRHARSSSITSLSHVAQQMAASPSNRPPSMIGKVEAQDRSNTPETEFDDDASIAESAISISSRIRRNEAERIQYFENQSDCGKLESHRAFCTRCGKFVSLGTKQTYTVRPWEKHRTRCDQKSPRPVVTKAETEGGDSGPVADGSVRRTEADRKALLEADERAEVSEPDRVKCRKCQKWIRLFAGTTKYSLQNWNKHQLSCSGSIPSDRVASAERKLRIVNDAQAKSFDSDSVDCNSCGEHVILKGEGEYNLTKWEEHKLQCISDSKVNATSSPPPPFSGETVLPPSTGTALLESESEGIVSALDTTNLKRGREDEVAADDVDGRPSTRPRIAAYEPPNSEAPGPFGWFMLPFKAFARGFRESLEGESSS